MKRFSAEMRLLSFLLLLTSLFLGVATLTPAAAQSGCVIPDAGPWPPCATGGNTPSTPTGDCVIPQSGPWPPCATGGQTPSAPAGDCVIPASGPWPSCATGGGTAPMPPASGGGCVIPASGPWPPCATGGGAQPAAPAATLPSALNLTVVGTGYAQPVFLTHAGDGRIFVVEKIGRIKELNSGATYFDISGRVNSNGGEQGLLSMAFHPNHKQNGRVFVYYIDQAGDTVVAEYADSNGTLDAGSEKIILRVPQPAGNHNGGQIAFGRDGMLYIGLGDGGGAGDPFSNGQNRFSLLGSILRIDINREAPYTIPADNPNAGCPTCDPIGLAEIWAYGLRNPWRFSFDRANGDLYIGDVGQDQREEISFAPAGQGGQNFGWNAWEGTFCFISDCRNVAQTPPITEYDHSQGCSITGGYVYRGSAIPSLRGVYLYGDFCSGSIWATAKPANGGQWPTTLVRASDISIGSFGQDSAGELYVLDVDGTIYKIVP